MTGALETCVPNPDDTPDVQSPFLPATPLAVIRLEYLSWWQAAGLFALLMIPVVALGWRPLRALGPARRWVAMGARALVVALAVLILAGLRVERENAVVEVMLLRDISDSARQAAGPGKTIAQEVNQYAQAAVGPESAKRPVDRLGMASFDGSAYIDLVPSDNGASLLGQTSAVNRQSPGTDPAAAIQLALSSFNEDARHRIVLVWDGNKTEGDLDAAVAAAKAQGVPIDVMPLKYAVKNETFIERFVAPTWRREKEPFSLDVILNNTASFPTKGTLRIEQEGRPLDLDPTQPGVQSGRAVTLQPGRNRESVTVDPIEGVDVRRFKAVWEPDRGADNKPVGDTLAGNNVANAFTFVRGKGKTLYIDNTGDAGGLALRQALTAEGITVDATRGDVDSFPTSLVELQGFDAVVLANVPRGAGGLSDVQQRTLAQYVHDTGGGLVVIGGPDALGAGGWQGSELEEVLPVDMDVPAKRQIAKGALALVMHSTEMSNGNYWGEQCALKAVEVLNRKDDIGVLSYNWSAGGAAWDFPLQPKSDGSRVYGAIKNMQLGDMPDFDDALDLALNGNAGSIGLKDSDARQKHVIIISDMDPAAPSPALLKAYQDAKISISTVQCFGHGQPLMPVAKMLAEQTGGRAYGPIEDNPSQLPQIFIKEATIVRRSLIKEDAGGIPVVKTLDAAGSQLVAGVPDVPPVTGYVLTSKKDSPLVEVPLVVAGERDPLLAVWQAGLGKSAVWTSDAGNRWATAFATGSDYQKFWAQVLRGVSRAPQSGDYDVQTKVENGRGTITVEAFGDEAKFKNNLTIRGQVLGEGGQEAMPIRLVQTKPGTYVGEFDARKEGNYVVALSAVDPEGGVAALRGGTAVNGGEEMKDLRDNEAAVRRVAEETGGRVIPAFAVGPGLDLFAVDYTDALGVTKTLPRSYSPLPIWDWLIPVLLALILLDVAIRRIAWDWEATKAVAARAGARVRSVTATTREDVEGKRGDAATLGALRQTREQVAAGQRQPPPQVVARPDPTRKFDAGRDVPSGDLSDVIGGATDKPVPKGPAGKVTPKGQQGDKPGQGGGMSDLMEAKRRARERMRDQE